MSFRWGVLGWFCRWEEENLRQDFDTCERSALVGPFVGGAGREIIDGGALDGHGVGALGVISQSTCPFNRAVRVVGISSRPDAHPNGHRGLRVVVSPIRGGIWESSHERAINVPFELIGRPVNGVVVEPRSRIGSVGERVVDRTVVGCRVAFSKVIGLSMRAISSQELPIHLIQIVRLEHD